MGLIDIIRRIKMAIQFFGACDRKGKLKTGSIRSEYPVWYHPQRIRELEEEIDSYDRKVASGAIDKTPNYAEYKAEIDRKRVLLNEISADIPDLKGKELDRVAKAYETLGEQIKELMPTRTNMTKGLANAHEELRKDTTPCVNVDGFVDLARECGVAIEAHGKTITRKQAMKAWKIMGRALGSNSNVEYLRRDANYGTYHGERSIDQMIREDN